MHRCTDAQMHRCTDAQMHRCTDAHVHTCTNAHMHKCTIYIAPCLSPEMNKRFCFCLYVMSHLSTVLCVGLNVTIIGADADAKLPVIAGWNITNIKTEIVNTSDVCPIGSFCPIGASDPVPCPPGRLGLALGLGDGCPDLCPADHYCPNSTLILPCPVNTFSLAGASSLEQCRCEVGYGCSYVRDFLLRVNLDATVQAWQDSVGLQSSVLQALKNSTYLDLDFVLIASYSVKFGAFVAGGV